MRHDKYQRAIMLKHGQETLVTDFDKWNIVKTPLARSMSKRQDWLTRQRSAADTMRSITEIGNDAYVIPKTRLVDTDNFRIVEERVGGVPLTPLLFRSLDNVRRESIIDGLAQFYGDIHKIHSVANPVKYQMRYELKLDYLTDFIQKGMRKWFPMPDVNFVRKVFHNVNDIEYETQLVWAHNDIFDDNVLYNARTNKCAIIDFTKAGYSFLHYDIIDSYVNDMGIFNEFRKRYLEYRGNDNLPDNFTDSDQWNKILKYHRVVQTLVAIDEDALDLQIVKDTESTVKKMRNNVELLYRLWSR
jgi:serine/threonine protein kinase